MMFYLKYFNYVFVIIAILLLGLSGPDPSKKVTSNLSNRAGKKVFEQTYAQVPISFEANQGQVNSRVNFISRGHGYNIFLTPTEAVFSLQKPTHHPIKSAIIPSPDISSNKITTASPAILQMTFDGANSNPQIVGLEESPGKANYFLGNDRGKWRTNIPTYQRVEYQDLYPGIDLIYYGNQSQVEYDFVIAPGADPKHITLSFRGTDDMFLDGQGNLVLAIGDDQIQMRKPLIYQKVNGVRQEIPGGYLLAGSDQAGFQVGAYDITRSLVIDPILVYSTYLGGGGNELGFGVAADEAGNAYVTGLTFSPNFPTVDPLQGTLLGTSDVFVTKFDPTGIPIYSTYFGGLGTEDGGDIAVDAAGNVYVTGRTRSIDFPTLNPLQAMHMGGGNDGFVTKLDPTGSVVYSTYLGGWYGDISTSIAIDSDGNVYLTGVTNSPNFPTVGPIQGNVAGAGDLFIAKLNTAGSALLYSTYLGGTNYDDGRNIAVDAAGNAYVTGLTYSTDFPTASPIQANLAGTSGTDAFVLKLNSAGSALLYSTYLGGTAGFYGEWGQGLTIDNTGNVYVTGTTFSSDFPTTGGAFQSVRADPGANSDAFVTKLNAAGSALVYSTYLGGTHSNTDDGASDIAVDATGQAYIIGYTRSTSLPMVKAIQPTIGGSKDAFVATLNPTGSELVFSTFLGGSGDDNEGGVLGEGPYAPHIAVDSAGNNVYVAGNTSSIDFPTVFPFQPNFGGGLFDAFVVKIANNQPPTVEAGGPYTVVEGGAIILRASGNDPESGLLTYAWDLDNDGSFETPGQSASFSAAGLEAPDSRTIKVKVTDSDNIFSIDDTTVNVIYNFSGFFQPVDNLPILNSVTAGRAIPVKFSLGGNQGLDIFASGYPSSATVTCGNIAEDAVEEIVMAGSSSLSYHSGNDEYVYIWKTDKAWAGTCRTLVLKLKDGTYHRANFMFK